MKELKMYYGITDFKPMIVNPNKKELSNFLGKELKYDPKYIFEKNGIDKLKLDIYGVLPEGNNSKTKVSFWFEDRLDISKSGKQKYINGQGLTSYNLEKLPKHIYTKNFRESYVGEEFLVNFLSKLLSWKVDVLKMKAGEYPDNFINVPNLFKENFSEIEKSISRDKTVKVYVGVVSQNNYLESAIYNKLFLNSMAKNLNPIIEALSSQYTSFYGNIAPIQENFVLGPVNTTPPPKEDDFDENLPF
jgi:hypothetical protein